VKKLPLGVLILGGVNVFLFGIIPLIISCLALLNLPSSMEKVLESLKESEPLFNNIAPQHLKALLLSQTVIALMFLISGLGLFLRKEWARKMTIYFAFALLILTALSILRVPALAKQTLLNVIYPAILIFYFTNKNIGEYFNKI
jgi:hypothetical protein